MIANNASVQIPDHPGLLIRNELERRKISQAKLARQIGISSTLLNEVVNGKRAVNADLALLIEAALGISAHTFLTMQAEYNLYQAKSDESFVSRLASIRKM